MINNDKRIILSGGYMKIYFIEKRIEKTEVYEVVAKNCDEAKKLLMKMKGMEK